MTKYQAEKQRKNYVKVTDCFVFEKFGLERLNLCPERGDLSACFVLIDRDLVLYVTSSIRIFERVKSLNEIPIRRGYASDHHSAAEQKRTINRFLNEEL